MSTTMNTRLKQFLAAENISQAELAERIQVVRASVSHILSGRNNPSYDFIKGLMENYPRLNIEWLFFGKGKMYKDLPEQITQAKPAAPQTDVPEESDDTPQLFSFEEEEAAEESIPAEIPIASKTSEEIVQKPAKQRKVKKIIVLFDDESYQEL